MKTNRCPSLRMASALLLFLAYFAVAEEPDKPLSEGDLFQLFGTGVSTNLTWTKKVGPDFEIFWGRPAPPGTGEVGLYIGYFPDFDPKCFDGSFETELGSFKVKWYKKVREPEAIQQEAVIDLKDDGLKAYIWIHGTSQTEADELMKEVSKLSRFLKDTSEK